MIMKYKGYVGSQEISVEDDVLHGKLLHIRDLVTYEAETPKALEAAFQEAVDSYIADCEADGVEPDKPFKGQFNVRITPELHRQLSEGARDRGCTLNEYVSHILHEHENRGYTQTIATQEVAGRMQVLLLGQHQVSGQRACTERLFHRSIKEQAPGIFHPAGRMKKENAIQ